MKYFGLFSRIAAESDSLHTKLTRTINRLYADSIYPTCLAFSVLYK